LNAIIDITSYYCVILKMVILHDAIKTIQIGDFVLFLKNKNPLFFSKKQKHPDLKRNEKNQVGWDF